MVASGLRLHIGECLSNVLRVVVCGVLTTATVHSEEWDRGKNLKASELREEEKPSENMKCGV